MWKILLFTIVIIIVNIQYGELQLYPEYTEYPEIQQVRGDLQFGGCKVAIDRLCPDPDIQFFLYTRRNPANPEIIRIGSDSMVSNLSETAFNTRNPTKIIIHGYNSDMDLPALVEIRKQYLQSRHYDYNVFTVDWSPLSQGPCYPAAVWNIKHAGQCIAQLVDRIRESGAKDLHLIGFSLGAQVTNFVALSVRPYRIPRITGLDPAMPGFVIVGPDQRLDRSDAEFVDIMHTNAFMQGTFLESGHVDFFVNGGVMQPGCWVENRFFACNHHRAPIYFAESINTKVGFWAWPCPSYSEYLIGRCPPKPPQIIMGEHTHRNLSGVHLVITSSVPPYAVGKFDGPSIEIYIKSELQRLALLMKYKKHILTYLDEDDLVEALQKQQNSSNNNSNRIYNERDLVDMIFL